MLTLDEAAKLLYKYRHIDDDLIIEDVNLALELAIEALEGKAAREREASK